jgi:starch phosphorylase
VRIDQVRSDIPAETQVGTANKIWADIQLGELTPDDVTVELYYGTIDLNGEIQEPNIAEMTCEDCDPVSEQGAPNTYRFVKHLTCQSSGMHGFTVRVVPSHPEQVSPFETGLIVWG